MEVSAEALRTTISAMSDEELLKRWQAKLFTETALETAESEIKRRGLDTSVANVEQIRIEEQASLGALRSRKYINFLSSFMVAAACAGFARLGAVPVVIAGLVAWPISRMIASWIDRQFNATQTRVILGFAAFIAVLLVAFVVGLFAKIALRSLAPASAPATAVAAAQRVLTEHTLRAMAETQNKALPTKTSGNLELTRIDAGPGMQLTYQVRVLAAGISKDSLSDTDITAIQSEAIKEGCSGFRAGLESGITYVMAYNAIDGTNLFSFPIAIFDCQ